MAVGDKTLQGIVSFLKKDFREDVDEDFGLHEWHCDVFVQLQYVQLVFEHHLSLFSMELVLYGNHLHRHHRLHLHLHNRIVQRIFKDSRHQPV